MVNARETAKRAYDAPKVQILSAGDAETGGTGINDNGPVGNARS